MPVVGRVGSGLPHGPPRFWIEEHDVGVGAGQQRALSGRHAKETRRVCGYQFHKAGQGDTPGGHPLRVEQHKAWLDARHSVGTEIKAIFSVASGFPRIGSVVGCHLNQAPIAHPLPQLVLCSLISQWRRTDPFDPVFLVQHLFGVDKIVSTGFCPHI